MRLQVTTEFLRSGLVWPQLPAQHKVSRALDMSDQDAAWTLWYLALAACADVAYGAQAARRDAREVANAEALHCRCLSDMALVRRRGFDMSTYVWLCWRRVSSIALRKAIVYIAATWRNPGPRRCGAVFQP